MTSTNPETASNTTERRQPLKKKAKLSANSSRTSTPNAYSRRSPPREREQQLKRSSSQSPPRDPDNAANNDDGDRSPPRKLKRPGGGARIATAQRSAVEEARMKREAEERKAVNERQTSGADLIASHYNAVPERGREWRKTDSQIKGLRSLNNWVKSTLIQKFSRPEMPVEHLTVLDMACGKGGDLGKWEKAPLVPSLYLGVDVADVSVQQARGRWEETLRKTRGRHRRGVEMSAEFYVHDAFAKTLADIPRVRQVGFTPNAGPGPGVIQGGMATGGFDVVSMMFALHYSFESETLARGMLGNVAGALKKGGRFFGVMPDSDIISGTVKRILLAEAKTNGQDVEVKEKNDGEEGEVDEEDDWDPEKPSDAVNGTVEEGSEDDWDPEKPSEPQTSSTTTNGTKPNTEDDNGDDWDPEKASSSTPKPSSTSQQDQSQPTLPPLEWGNTLYTIRFPRSHQPAPHLPKDGIFRPPYGWRYHYTLEEAVDVPEYVVPWEGFRALAEEYGLELMYRKGFREVLEDESGDKELGMLAERMGVLSRDRSQGRAGLLVGEEELEAGGFYLAFCFYKT